MSIGQRFGQLAIAQTKVGGGSGSAPSLPPSAPVLTAPATGVNLFNGIAATLSATSVDGDLDRIDFVLDPPGANTVVATDLLAPYSQSWTPTGISAGSHTLVARAVRSGQSTDSASITINVGEVLHTLVSSVPCVRAWQSDFGVTNAGGGTCSSWTDQKNSANAVQVTGANQPAIISNAVGTRTAIHFDGTNDVLRDATLTIPAPGTTPTFVWVVFKQLIWSATRFLIATGNTGGASLAIIQHTATPNMSTFNGSFTPDNNGAPLNSLVLCTCLFSNNASDTLVVGTTTATGTAGNVAPPIGFMMGALSNGTFPMNVDIFACLLFAGAPSAGELAALRSAAIAMYPGILA